MPLSEPSRFRLTRDAMAASLAEQRATERAFPLCPNCSRPMKAEIEVANVAGQRTQLRCEHCEGNMKKKIIVTEDCTVYVDGVNPTHFAPRDEPYSVTPHAYDVLIANGWGKETEEDAKARQTKIDEAQETTADQPAGPISDVSKARVVTRVEPIPAAPLPIAAPVIQAQPVKEEPQRAVPPSPTARPRKQ